MKSLLDKFKLPKEGTFIKHKDIQIGWAYTFIHGNTIYVCHGRTSNVVYGYSLDRPPGSNISRYSSTSSSTSEVKFHSYVYISKEENEDANQKALERYWV